MFSAMLQLMLVLAVLTTVNAQACRYGVLPGRFSSEKPSGEKWQLLVNKCTLVNRLDAFVTSKQPSTSVPDTSILFIGDSTDNYLLGAICDYVKGKITRSDKNPMLGSNICRKAGSPSLVVGQVYSPSLTSTPVVNLPGYDTLPGFDTKVKLARASMLEALGGKEPNVVVLGGGMWDIFRWTKAPLKDLAPEEREVRTTLEVSSALEAYWLAQVKRAMSIVRRTFPQSRILWRAYAMPNWDQETGKALNPNIGTKPLLAAAKAIGKAAALEAGIEIVDIDRMVQAFYNPTQYLVDKHHAKPEIYLEAVNVMLNIHLNGASSTASKAKLQG